MCSVSAFYEQFVVYIPRKQNQTISKLLCGEVAVIFTKQDLPVSNVTFYYLIKYSFDQLFTNYLHFMVW